MNRDTTKLSVVMSVYNGRKYLPAAVESVLEQSFRDFEFIVINDGSTDGSGRWLDGRAKRDRRIRVIHQENRGLTASLNAGVLLAQGEFIARMDADDITHSSRFAKQIQFLDCHPEIVALSCLLKYIDPDGDTIGTEDARPTDHESIVKMLFAGHGALPHPAAMIRRDALQSTGGYREEFTAAQDLDLWLRLSEKGRLANLDSVLHSYRFHEHSVTTTKRALQRQCVLKAVDEACLRQGIPRPNLNDLDTTDEQSERLEWAKMALKAGYFRTARKHAWLLLRQQPFCVAHLRMFFKSCSRNSK